MLRSRRYLNAVHRITVLPSGGMRRSYYPTIRYLEDADAANAASSEVDAALKMKLKRAAQDYNVRNADYKRQVSALRRNYAEEVAKQRAADKAEQEALERELTRRRLERQRQKNIRSAQNAIRQKELRDQRAKEFEAHLEKMQEKREETESRFTAARQLVINELEEEAPLWLTSAEEVEERFTPEAEQLLWARPGGVLGAPNPTIDSHFWQYETHTWHMSRTYKSQRQVLLEELEEIAYEEANVDESFWTADRLEKQTRLEDKARLRAMVHSTGRMELLKKQRQIIDDQSVIEPGEIPKSEGVPSLRMLNDDRVLETEGARHLLRNPTKFFKFENETAHTTANEDLNDRNGDKEYSGPSLGAPIGLRDPLRPNGESTVFPQIVGKYPKPDMRTEREKKQAEREARMLAAAGQTGGSEEDVDLLAEDRDLEDIGQPIDYNDNEWDSDDEDWPKGLDPVTERDVIDTPPDQRYAESDIDWVLQQLEGNVEHYEQQYVQDVETLQQRARTELEIELEKQKETLDPDSLENIVLNMPDKELIALSELDGLNEEGSMTDEQFSEAAKKIPSLTEQQLKSILGKN